jgi:UDP-N-acetylglucosamine--N-acetylmuramyl-(pentapeptide) pyrophosphoryl-undecaprenol N-acetylglucosamine transferase
VRVVLSGGGTGGHVYPALAVAEQCLQVDTDSQFLYIGTNSGLERDIVEKSKLEMPFEAIEIRGFRRKLVSLDNIKTVMKFLKGVNRSKELLRNFKPDIVIGTGGYVCGPVLYAAAKLGIPTLIHEQNAIAGLTNKFLSRYANSVLVSFKGTESIFSKAGHVLYSGNPRATSVVNADPEEGYQSLGIRPGTQIVLVVGGSRGAKAINRAMIEMASLVNKLSDIQFIFVTGAPYYEETRAAISALSPDIPNLAVLPYVHNMPEVLAAASLVINRAGASTIAEITALGLPSILIPSPNVTGNHQEYNARQLSDQGAAELILEKDLSGVSLFEKISDIMQNPIRAEHMSIQAKKLGEPESAMLIVKEMQRLLKNSF